jgi:hypothetical protein
MPYEYYGDGIQDGVHFVKIILPPAKAHPFSQAPLPCWQGRAVIPRAAHF